ncbi:MAG: Rrf2 family transcriptional regulator [Bacteroidia bacterium]|nr:Rrf2 family transcriptional regulator [Bacteroidia bacterium]
MLSKKAQYSLYALVHLAKEYKNGPVLISKIAEDEKIPKKFLEAILLELKTIGIVNSRKGKGGGYYLIKNPEKVTLVEIIRKFDGAIALLPCVSDMYYEQCRNCNNEETCGIRSVMKEVRDTTVNMLSNTSLADIIRREENVLH